MKRVPGKDTHLKVFKDMQTAYHGHPVEKTICGSLDALPPGTKLTRDFVLGCTLDDIAQRWNEEELEDAFKRLYPEPKPRPMSPMSQLLKERQDIALRWMKLKSAMRYGVPYDSAQEEVTVDEVKPLEASLHMYTVSSKSGTTYYCFETDCATALEQASSPIQVTILEGTFISQVEDTPRKKPKTE